MKAAILAVMLAVSILPTSIVWAQQIGPKTTLTVEVLSPYSYKADDGSTVVIGEVQNNNNFPVTGVKLGVSFYDDKGKILEYKTGSTLLKVIPPQGKVPFSISSTKHDSTITDVSVNLTAFNSSPIRPQSLTISPDELEISDQLVFSGSIINGGTILTTGTTIYLISYDAFGRVVGIATAMPQPDDIGVGKTSTFSIVSAPEPKARSYKIIAESDQYQSALVDITNVKTKITLTKLVAITGTSVTDLVGNEQSTIHVGTPAKITSGIWIKYAADQSTEQPYVCYIQIKEILSESHDQNKTDASPVAFLGMVEGVFHGAEKQNVSVNWVPEKDGAYFIEVYVWDPNAVALANPSPINVILVK